MIIRESIINDLIWTYQNYFARIAMLGRRLP